MKQTYIRTIIGIIWLIAAVSGLITANFLMTAIGGIIGIIYLISANNIRKKEKDNKE